MKVGELSPKDLRIGNILIEKYTGHQLVVSELTKNRITFDYQTLEKWQAEPIPLSEEVLLKCGFEKVRSNYEEAETFDFFRGFIWFDMANQSTKLYGKYALGFVPEYLHQLQNLYYAITGKELEVKWN